MSSNEVKTKDNNCIKTNNKLNRKSLQLLQPVSNNNKLLTRNMNKISKQSKDKTSKNQTINKWLTDKDSIDFDLKYWKTLAKEREKALQKALQQNEELVHENDCLKRENEHLSQLAEEGVRLKNLLQEYID
jgi:hypothetical protein